MSKSMLFMFLIVSLLGCSITETKDPVIENHPLVSSADASCPGSTAVPAEYENMFEAVEDKPLLESALGTPLNGKLCKGQVWRTKKNIDLKIYRAWNSTNSHSRLGNWWAFSRPEGNTADYRRDYIICYQWTPLDRLTHCTLKPGIKLVVGPGQSQKCSDYLTYPASASKQIYIQPESLSGLNCSDYADQFHWVPEPSL